MTLFSSALTEFDGASTLFWSEALEVYLLSYVDDYVLCSELAIEETTISSSVVVEELKSG